MIGDFITMKYGNIICDPTSKEARNLIGKKVIAGSFYDVSNPSDCSKIRLLTEIKPNRTCPFLCTVGIDYNSLNFESVGEPFIREVIEELTYKPFNNFSELLSNYLERIQIEPSRIKNFDFPTIWVKRKPTKKDKSFFISVCGGDDKEVFLSNCYPISYTDLFDMFTFIDGSPCGKLCSDVLN